MAVPGSSSPLSVFAVYLGLFLRLYLRLLYVCVVPGLLAPPSTSALSLALPKVLKKELINIAFLDSLGNHLQFAVSFCSIAHSIAHSIALLKIYSLYRVPGLGARISRV